MILSPWGPLPWWLVTAFAAILGAALGSFANVLIYRLPAEESLFSPPSRCPKCGRRITPLENIPVLSWIILGGKCRGCKAPVSIQYPLIELTSAVFFVSAILLFGITYKGIAFGLLFIGLLALIIIDLRHWLLPFAITIPLALLGLAGAAFFDLRPLKDSLLGMAVGAGIFALLIFGGKWAFKKEAMGGGDLVFGIMAGAFLGWKLTLFMVFVASLLGTVFALFLMILGRDVSGKMVPFGPFLAVGMVVSLFLGDSLIAGYVSLFSQ